jgi:elongation factor G
METEGDFQVVSAEAPLKEMQTYATLLRAMTHGEGSFSMEFLRYQQVPSHLQADIVAELGELVPQE